jgi:pimeloyl-ACP methyl ester carboxylesterase
VDTTGGIDRLEIDTRGFRFTARACGPEDGRRVLLLHGFPQTSWAWRDELWALASAGYRAVAPDLRGYSRGARPAELEAYATDVLVGDVLALADAMEMEAFDLVGHDWGGMLAWIATVGQPERVRSLAVVSTPHPLALERVLRGGGDPGQVGQGAATEAFRVPEVPERLLLGPEGDGAGLATLLAESGLDADDARVYVRALSEPGALTAALNWYRAMDRSMLDGFGPVRVPTLYVWPSGDAVPRVAAEDTAEFVEGPYAFEVLENVSHWVPEMAPVELSDLLVRHLAAH